MTDEKGVRMAKVGMALILAQADNGVIGSNGALPWHIPADIQHFKKLTVGKPCIIGRKTFVSIGKALPRRLNIVLSRDSMWSAEDAVVCHDLLTAKSIAYEDALRTGADEVMIVGGAEIFRQTIDEATRIYLTEIHAPFVGDVTFQFSREDWRESSRREANEGALALAFLELRSARAN